MAAMTEDSCTLWLKKCPTFDLP